MKPRGPLRCVECDAHVYTLSQRCAKCYRQHELALGRVHGALQRAGKVVGDFTPEQMAEAMMVAKQWTPRTRTPVSS